MLYPPFKNAFECPSVRSLSVRLSVRPSAYRFHSLLGAFLSIFFKLAMRVDIGMECPGIADGKILAKKYRVTA